MESPTNQAAAAVEATAGDSAAVGVTAVPRPRTGKDREYRQSRQHHEPGEGPRIHRSRRSTTFQSMFRKKASMYFPRSVAL